MASKINIGNLSSEVMRQLNEYADLTTEGMKTAVQNAGNRFLGLPMYGQQLLAAIGCLGLIATILYGKFVLEKAPRISQNAQ